MCASDSHRYVDVYSITFFIVSVIIFVLQPLMESYERLMVTQSQSGQCFRASGALSWHSTDMTIGPCVKWNMRHVEENLEFPIYFKTNTTFPPNFLFWFYYYFVFFFYIPYLLDYFILYGCQDAGFCYVWMFFWLSCLRRRKALITLRNRILSFTAIFPLSIWATWGYILQIKTIQA